MWGAYPLPPGYSATFTRARWCFRSVELFNLARVAESAVNRTGAGLDAKRRFAWKGALFYPALAFCANEQQLLADRSSSRSAWASRARA